MAKKEYLEGYEKGLKAVKAGEAELPEKYYKNKLDKLVNGPGYFTQKDVKDYQMSRIKNDKYLDTDMGRGDAQGRKEMKKTEELESIRDKKNPPKAIPMTKEDAEVINTKEFKKASEGTKDMKKGGMVKSSASKRADGIAVKGKTRGKIC
jgi:hypothetical protein